MEARQILESILQREGIKYAELARRMGMSRAQPLYDIRDGKVKRISTQYADKIIKAFPQYNRTWLLTGDGAMIGESKAGQGIDKISKIKYYPNVEGMMGDCQFFDNPDEIYVEFILPGYQDCKYAINAYGDSMIPLIKSGDVALLAPWTENYFAWGKVYFVVTKSGYRVIKRLYPGSDDAHVMCVSENKDMYPPYEVEREDIVSCFIVKGRICRDEI